LTQGKGTHARTALRSHFYGSFRWCCLLDCRVCSPCQNSLVLACISSLGPNCTCPKTHHLDECALKMHPAPTLFQLGIVTHAVAGLWQFVCRREAESKLRLITKSLLSVVGSCNTTAVHHSRLQSSAQMAAEVTPDLFVNVTSTGPSLPSVFLDRKLPEQLSLGCSSSLQQQVMLVPLSTSNLPRPPTNHQSLETAVLAAPTRLLPLLAALAPAEGDVDVQTPAAAKLAHMLSGQTSSGGQQHRAKRRPMKVCRR
jgi:hypothetical protein